MPGAVAEKLWSHVERMRRLQPISSNNVFQFLFATLVRKQEDGGGGAGQKGVRAEERWAAFG